jgi:glutathione S-transferase
MPMKLYAHPDNYKTKKALIAAKYVGLEIDTPPGATAAAQTGKIPVLETPQGCIFSSTAIARYISRISRTVGLYGQNLIEGGMIDSWIEFCTHELEVPLCTWVLPKMGVFAEIPEATAAAKEDVKKALTVLNNHLLHNTYMVGHTVTLADISVCCALVDGMKLVLDDEFRKPYGNLMRWFNLCTSQPEFAAILGQVKPAGKGSGQAPAAKKEAAPKKDAAPKKEAAAKKEAAPKKEGKKEDKKKEDKKDEEPKEKTPEELAEERKKKIKKVKKEGGKRGVEIEGAADMGGLQFFCTSVDEPEGDMEFLVMCLEAMNEKSDPTEEERKGGSGHIGKMIFSAGTEQLSVAAYVPDEKQGQCDCADWLATVLALHGGKVEKADKAISTGCVKTDSNKNIFPLKIRESMIIEANNFLRKRGLFPEDNGSDSDEMVFGDEDFPS